ncbi:TlpA family protein disulfide reductase [Flagellimonas myxillae]|uniref:TlpA family protein disulfide reductase n=1 Tax=Flagellimonas myxillae TaxID=2942214 RepID=UPI00201EEF94|nr:redoxin domain-containing protein [Muricauda myxillae]MCL6267684.1 redoxin domain-containing protein [Muricauda myxillae]
MKLNIRLKHLAMGIIGLLILFLVGSCKTDPDKTQENQLYSGTMAPDFELNSVDGQTMKLSDYKGKFVVLHFATTWCPFCNAEAPYLKELAGKYDDVSVIIVDVKESKELVKEKLVDKFELNFPVLLDTDGAVATNYAPKDVLPDLARDEVMLASNLLIDPAGKIQFLSLLDSKDFDAELLALKARLHELR